MATEMCVDKRARFNVALVPYCPYVIDMDGDCMTEPSINRTHKMAVLAQCVRYESESILHASMILVNRSMIILFVFILTPTAYLGRKMIRRRKYVPRCHGSKSLSRSKQVKVS